MMVFVTMVVCLRSPEYTNTLSAYEKINNARLGSVKTSVCHSRHTATTQTGSSSDKTLKRYCVQVPVVGWS